MKPNNLVTPEPGNQLAVKSGAYSPIIVGAKADELRSHVIEAAPWTADPSFSGTLQLYCMALATALLGQSHIAKVAEERGYGAVPSRLVETVNGSTNTAARLGTLLGLDPRAKATIQSLTASTENSLAALDRLADRGRPFRERREAQLRAQKDETESDHET